MSDPNEKRLSWLALVFDSAIKHGVLRAADVILHATPEILARDLPRELVVRMFEGAFSAGKLTPESVLAVAPPTTLVKHISAATLWEVVRDAAARQGIVAQSGSVPKVGKTPVRTWLAEIIAGGLEAEVVSPADVTRHVPPGEWVKDVPLEVVARMIASGLTKPQFDPRLALEHLTPAIIGEFVSPHLSWALLDEGATRALELDAGKNAPRPIIRAASIPPPPPIAAAGNGPASRRKDADSLGSFHAESVDAWVDPNDIVDSVESSSGGTN